MEKRRQDKARRKVSPTAPARPPSSMTGGATLLERLLGLLRTGGVHSLDRVAEALGTSPALVETMLEDLGRRGYLRAVGGHCEEHCQACPLTGDCTIAGAGRVWSFTDRGPAGPGLQGSPGTPRPDPRGNHEGRKESTGASRRRRDGR